MGTVSEKGFPILLPHRLRHSSVDITFFFFLILDYTVCGCLGLIVEGSNHFLDSRGGLVAVSSSSSPLEGI